jgi:hypothetical protein
LWLLSLRKSWIRILLIVVKVEHVVGGLGEVYLRRLGQLMEFVPEVLLRDAHLHLLLQLVIVHQLFVLQIRKVLLLQQLLLVDQGQQLLLRLRIRRIDFLGLRHLGVLGRLHRGLELILLEV